jgi:hypothetical protein
MDAEEEEGRGGGADDNSLLDAMGSFFFLLNTASPLEDLSFGFSLFALCFVLVTSTFLLLDATFMLLLLLLLLLFVSFGGYNCPKFKFCAFFKLLYKLNSNGFC